MPETEYPPASIWTFDCLLYHDLMIHHSRPTVSRKDEQALMRVLRSGQLGGGAEVDRFEAEMQRKVRQDHVVATHTGTSALHLALLALDLKPGARVLMPTYVCAAVLHAVRYVGATPVLVDVDPIHGNMDPADLRRRRPQARAVIVPHMFGKAAPVEEICRLRIPVIEDCAMALGGRKGGKPLGSFGDISIFSFYATKMMATGHGGAVATSRSMLARKLRNLVQYDNRDDSDLRFNYRMSGLIAGIGRSQLQQLGDFVKARRQIADFYYSRFRRFPLGLPERGNHVYYRFVVRTGSSLIRHLQKRNIEAKRPVYRPLHRIWSANRGSYPGAEELHRSAVSLPCYPSLGRAGQKRVAAAVVEYVERLA